MIHDKNDIHDMTHKLPINVNIIFLLNKHAKCLLHKIMPTGDLVILFLQLATKL